MSTIGYYICVPFAWVLRTFYELTGSYGWALVLFDRREAHHAALPDEVEKEHDAHESLPAQGERDPDEIRQ